MMFVSLVHQENETNTTKASILELMTIAHIMSSPKKAWVTIDGKNEVKPITMTIIIHRLDRTGDGAGTDWTSSSASVWYIC